MGVLFLMPILGRWKLGHRFNVGFLCVVMLGIGMLTVQAMRSERLRSRVIAMPSSRLSAAERAVTLGSRA